MTGSKSFLVAPSLLSADFSRMGEAVRAVESSGGDWIHLDVMDGSFVPDITFGPKMVADLRPLTKLPLDVHLMIDAPDRLIPAFAKAGSDHIIFHFEGNVHVNRIIRLVQSLGAKVGVAIVPSTPVHALSEVLGLLDIVLVMTVNPGLGGQELIPECLEKVRALETARSERRYRYLILVDGGINRQTARAVRDAGTDVLVTGSSYFSARDRREEVLFLKGTREA